jgi:hypothetical protein
MSHFMSQDERQRHGEQFLPTVYAMTDRNVEHEIGAEEVYARISNNLGGFGQKGEKTNKGQRVQQAIISDLFYHLTHERLNINGHPEPQIEVRKTGTSQYLKLTHAGMEHCIEECWLTPDSLNMKQPDMTKWKPRPIPSA